MGSKKGWQSVGGAVANVATGGYYGQQKMAKKQAAAAQSMADAMKQAPVSQSATQASIETEDSSAAEKSVNAAAKRRYRISDTVNNRNPLSSLSGLRKTLG
jgi:hypothetical protein